MGKFSGYALLSTPDPADYALVVDVSDPFMGSTGTDKRVTLSTLFGTLGLQPDSNSGDIQPPGTVSAGASALAARADHVHASGSISPADTGVIAWTDDPYSAGSSGGALQAGKLSLCMFWVRKTAVLSVIATNVVTAPTGTLTTNQNFAGIYNSSGTLMGQTADQTTAWATAGLVAMGITVPFSAAPGAYWAAFLGNGTGTAPVTPNFRGVGGSPLLVNSNLAAGQSRVGFYSSGLTALPASITPSSIVQAGANMYTVVIY